MTTQATPTLWLRCGACNVANLATVSAAAAPRIAESVPLPGDDLVIQPRPDGRWTAYTRRDDPDGFAHQFRCKPCGANYKVSAGRLASWWAEFTSARRRRDVRYLGRDR